LPPRSHSCAVELPIFSAFSTVILANAPIGERPTIADLSMTGYLLFPQHEAGYDLAAHHPAIDA